MTVNALLLDGWEETSTWGIDNGTFYAQLTPNGVSDVDGPQVWIIPPHFVVRDAQDLVRAIAEQTVASVDSVVAAMRRGAGPDDSEVLDRAAPPVPAQQIEQTTPSRLGGD